MYYVSTLHVLVRHVIDRCGYHSPGCGRRFAVISNLRRHFKVHKKVVPQHQLHRLPAAERLRHVQRLMERTAAMQEKHVYLNSSIFWPPSSPPPYDPTAAAAAAAVAASSSPVSTTTVSGGDLYIFFILRETDIRSISVSYRNGNRN